MTRDVEWESCRLPEDETQAVKDVAYEPEDALGPEVKATVDNVCN